MPVASRTGGLISASALIAALTLVGVAGCGSGSSSDGPPVGVNPPPPAPVPSPSPSPSPSPAPAPSPTGLTMQGLPTQLAQGSVATVVVYLPSPAGAGGATVLLQNSNTAAAQAPASVTVTEGGDVAAFNVDGLAAGSTTLTATSSGLDPASASTTVADANVALSASTGEAGLIIGTPLTLTITLASPAPSGGAPVDLTLSDASRATLGAARVVIAAGATSGTTTLTPTHMGGVTVVATMAGSAPAHRRFVVLPTVASATDTSATLIDAAHTAGTITAEQALVYGVYAAFGSPDLPAEYRGNDYGKLDGNAVRQAALAIDTLSPDAQTAIGRFLVPPIYSGSGGAGSAKAGVKSPAVRPRGLSVSCFSRYRGMPTTDTLPNWKAILTPSFKIWYPTVLSTDMTQFSSYTAEDNQNAALNVAATIQGDYDKLVAIFGEPLRDGGELCNGGDSRIDVYVTRVGQGEKAQVMPYLPGNCARPGWMWVAPDSILDPYDSRNIIAHELVHLFQMRYDRPDCSDWRWNPLDEATASWAFDHLYPSDNYEHRFLSGDQAYFSDDRGEWSASPLETAAGIRGCNGYCDFAFFEWLDRKYGPQAIRGVLDATATANPQQAFETGLSGIDGGLEKIWPKFALAQWNDYRNHIGDEFNTWEHVPAASISQGLVRDKNYFVEVTLNGASHREMGDVFHDQFRKIPSLDLELPPMTTNFIDLRFTDDNVSDVYFAPFNDVMHGEKPRLHVQALQKIDGQWKPAEDWTTVADKSYCRDKRYQRIEELVLIYSNSDAGTEPFQHDGPSVVQIYHDIQPILRLSNVSCMPWHGTSKTTVTGPEGGTWVSTGEVTFKQAVDPEFTQEELDALPLKLYVVDHGTATAQDNGVGITGCRTSTNLVSGPIGELDGQLQVRVDYGDAAGLGITTVNGANYTVTCPDTDTFVGPLNSQWLTIPAVSPVQIGPDGHTLKGTFTSTSPTGEVTVSEWDFVSEKE